MHLLRGLDEIDAAFRGGVVTVGNFDGVHQGHRRILTAVKELAQRLGGPSVVFTFDPHPLALLRPQSPPVPLCWVERKAELLEKLGIDILIAYPTTRQLLELDYRAFFQQLIVERLSAQGMVEGPNFFFGRDRQGNSGRLQQLCDEYALQLQIVELAGDQDEVISSSRIRELVSAGEIEQANRWLTAPYMICGQVAAGDQRGRELGFPTANLFHCPVLLPAVGVYAGQVRLGRRDFMAAVHIGPNPTFGDDCRKIEVHLLDFSGDLYGQQLSLELHYRLRNVRTFETVADLQQQLLADVATVRERMSVTGKDEN